MLKPFYFAICTHMLLITKSKLQTQSLLYNDKSDKSRTIDWFLTNFLHYTICIYILVRRKICKP